MSPGDQRQNQGNSIPWGPHFVSFFGGGWVGTVMPQYVHGCILLF